MVNVVRYSPIGGLFDAVFSYPAVNGLRRAAVSAATLRINLKEDNSQYTVSADLPGVKKEDVHVEIDGRQITISAERKAESETEDSQRVYRESLYGKVFRSFELEHEVDKENSTAKIENGILELNLKKLSNGAAKQLTIN